MSFVCESIEVDDPASSSTLPPNLERQAVGSVRAPSDAGAWRTHRITRFDMVLAFTLAGLALLARAPWILHGEMLLHSDEAIVGIMAQDIAEGRRLPIYFYGQRYMGALEAYVIAALRPLFVDPLVSLRLGPALFLAALVATQALLLTRWFGRRGAIVGALTLVAAAPMFAHWSIAARGGYIEVFWAGTLLWWAYSEWYVGREQVSARQQAWFGMLIGLGLWLNQMMLAFLAPVVVHALLARWRFPRRATWLPAPPLGRWLLRFLRTPAVLPLAATAPLVALSCLFAVQITPHGVQYSLLGGAVPPRIAGVFLGGLVACVAFAILRSPSVIHGLRSRLVAAAPLIFGLTLGQLPAMTYVAGQALASEPLAASIPLALRPVWSIGEPLTFACHGAPLLLGADPKPFLDLVLIGHDYQVPPVSPLAACAFTWLNVAVFVALGLLAVILVRRHRASLLAMLRMRPGVYSPPLFLGLACGAAVAAYLFSGASFHFNTIRYLLPLWVILPGLLAAAVCAAPARRITWVAVIVLLACWSAGQFQMWRLTRGPHPLEAVARDLRDQHVSRAVAEMFDAHLLSFLTRQETKVAEFRPCWSRLSHYGNAANRQRAVSYLVKVTPRSDRESWSFPGPPPLEDSALLAPTLDRWCRMHPHELVSKTILTGGYELWTVAQPLPDPVGP